MEDITHFVHMLPTQEAKCYVHKPLHQTGDLNSRE
jgi:hypothetical protein